jgi:hypothetical protein
LLELGLWAASEGASARLLEKHGGGCRRRGLGAGIPSAWAETPKDTLLVLVENGPNSLDIHGIGTTFRSYVACRNLYDRLLTFRHKTPPGGGLSYDCTKIEPELAEEFSVSPEGMSVTFKLRRNATFHDGAPVTAPRRQVVARPRRHGGRFSDLPDGRRQPAEARAICRSRRPHDPHRLSAQGQAHPA